jgi:hypothetical protein
LLVRLLIFASIYRAQRVRRYTTDPHSLHLDRHFDHRGAGVSDGAMKMNQRSVSVPFPETNLCFRRVEVGAHCAKELPLSVG